MYKNLLGSIYPASRALFKKCNQLNEKLCKIVYFVTVIVPVPAFILPKAIVCYFIYFKNDLDNDAFEMAIPMLYVHLREKRIHLCNKQIHLNIIFIE